MDSWCGRLLLLSLTDYVGEHLDHSAITGSLTPYGLILRADFGNVRQRNGLQIKSFRVQDT